jgi:hypothetical protein
LVVSRLVLGVSAAWAVFLGVRFVIDRLLPCSSNCIPGSGGETALMLASGISLVAFGVGVVSLAFSNVSVDDQELRVRNLFWRGQAVSLLEVTGAEPGYSGLVIHLDKGGEIVAVAVQTSNWRAWLGRPGRGRVIADQIIRRAELARARVGRPTA